MKSPTAKVVFLFALYIALHVAEACHKDAGGGLADCSGVLPHFDYQALKIKANTPVVSFGLTLNVEADSVVYLARQGAGDFRLISSAWACDPDGHDGPRFFIKSLNIYADRDFNDTLPEGAVLNSLFYQNGGDVLYPLTPNFQPSDFWQFESGIRPIELGTYEKPRDLGVPFRFRIEVEKTNGEKLTAESAEIFFL